MADIKQLIKTAAALRDALVKRALERDYLERGRAVNTPRFHNPTPASEPPPLEVPRQHMLSDIYDVSPYAVGAGGLAWAGGLGARNVFRDRSRALLAAYKQPSADGSSMQQRYQEPALDDRRTAGLHYTKDNPEANAKFKNMLHDTDAYKETQQNIKARRTANNYARRGANIARGGMWGTLGALAVGSLSGMAGSQFDNARQKNYLQALQQRIQQAQQSGSKQSSDTYVDHLTKLAGALRGFC